MKKIYYGIFSLFLTIGCEDFTEVGLPTNQIAKELVFNNDALANAAMSAIYRSLEENGFMSGSLSGANVYLGCLTDELISHSSATSDLSLFYQLGVQATNLRIVNLWGTTYKQIYNINSVIEGLLSSTNISEPLKEKLLGEAYFIRGFLHLHLVNTFGSVPYVVTTDYLVNQRALKQTKEEVYNLVSLDLQKSLDLLPLSYPVGKRVYPTKTSAYAVLARLAYYQKDWERAIFYSSQVLDNSEYKMEIDIKKTFLKDSSSAILQLLPYSGIYNALEANLYYLRTAPPSNVSLTSSFVNHFESGDLRRDLWVSSIKDTKGNGFYFPTKYKQWSTTASTLEYSVVLRVEEMYLIRSEASFSIGDISNAIKDINTLRSRVNLLPIVSQDHSIIRDVIWKERQSELFTEFGHRFYDLKHQQRIDAVMQLEKPNWKSFNQLLPIPEKDLLSNPNLGPQNEGY